MRLFVVLCALFYASALGARVCISGSDTLALGSIEPATTWYCTEDNCTVNWSFEFDTTVDQSEYRWPIEITVGDNSTLLSDLFPEIQSVDLQCSTSGDVIATTEHGPNNERFRMIWSYDYTSAYGCEELFPLIDFQTDYTNYQSLLSFSGSISFDGVLSTDNANKSLEALSNDCPSVSPTPSPSHGATPSITASMPHTPTPNPTEIPCAEVSCARGADYWLDDPNNAAWYVIADEDICGVSMQDILSDEGASVDLPINLLELAKSYIVVRLSCVAFGCEAPLDEDEADVLEAYRHAQQVFDNIYNCAANTERDEVRLTLDDWVHRKSGDECVNPASGESSPVNVENLKSERHSYLIWALVVTIILGVVLLAACVLCVFLVPYMMSYLQASGGRNSRSPIAITSNIDDDEYDTTPIACDRPKKDKKSKKKRNASSTQSTASPISDNEMEGVDMHLY